MKKEKNDCRFCNISMGQYKYPGIDEPIAENKNFFAIASIGAIVEGWTLIVPKQHCYSMRDLYCQQLMKDISSEVLNKITAKYGKTILFEHGANACDSSTSCGTAHAHMHIVPLTNSLHTDIQQTGLQWQKCKASEISTLANGKEYLFYCDPQPATWDDPKGLVHILSTPTSQFFRRLIAARQNKLRFADYKEYKFLHTAAQTRENLAHI